MILKGEHLLLLEMARDDSDATLQYPIRYRAEDNFTMDVDIRLNRYIVQTQARFEARYGAISLVLFG